VRTVGIRSGWLRNSNPISIERCELLGAEGSDLSDEAIEAIRDRTGALADLLIDVYLDQQRRERALGAFPKLPVRSRFGAKKEAV